MDKIIKPGDVVEYFGVRYLVFNITDKSYECISGYDFKMKTLSKNLNAGFGKVIDNNVRTEEDDVHVS